MNINTDTAWHYTFKIYTWCGGGSGGGDGGGSLTLYIRIRTTHNILSHRVPVILTHTHTRTHARTHTGFIQCTL